MSANTGRIMNIHAQYLFKFSFNYKGKYKPVTSAPCSGWVSQVKEAFAGSLLG